MQRRTVRSSLLALSAGALVVPFALTTAGAAPAQQGRAALTDTHPSWATPSAAVGAPARGSTVAFQAVLPLRDAAAAEQLASSVSNPKSAQYKRYLTPGAFNSRFAPSPATVGRVEKFLTGSGLSVDSVADGNRWVEAHGTVAQIDKTFDTTLRTYRVHGKDLRSPSGPVSVPRSVRADLMTVTGLDQGALAHPQTVRQAPAKSSPSAAAPTPALCSNYYGQYHQTLPAAYGTTSFPTYICGYTPDQIQSAYGVKNGMITGRDGKGVTVAILDAYGSPTIRADLKRYSRDEGLPYKDGNYKQKLFTPFNLQKECGGEGGWNGEQTLDVDAVHSMAPGATIQYVGAKNCDTGLDQAMNWVVQHHAADIVSNSYGYGGEDIPASVLHTSHSLAVQAAAEGIGLYFSSGDSGDEQAASGVTSPDYEASDPMVTAVGGTSLAIDPAGNRSFETGWGTDLDRVNTDYTGYTDFLPGGFYFGAGGGTSMLFKQPSYQKGVVPASLSRSRGGQPMRTVPDVAAVADPYTGFLVGQTTGGVYGTYAIGGTSLATPVFAGIQALASQGLSAPIGFANPVLYSLKQGAFHDITPSPYARGISNPSGSYLVTLDHDSSLQTGYRYDNVTGRGTPKGATFIRSERQSVNLG